MRMCTVTTTMHMCIDAIMKVSAAVLTASNCRKTVSLLAKYTSSKGDSMETVETLLDPPLSYTSFQNNNTAIKPQ